MQINSKSIFLRRVNEALLLKKISRRTANHFMSVYKKFDSKKRSEADDKADELNEVICAIPEYLKDVDNVLCSFDENKGCLSEYTFESDTIPTPKDFYYTNNCIETPEGDLIGIRHIMILSLAYDHRIVDGALGGMFLKRMKELLENFDPNTQI